MSEIQRLWILPIITSLFCCIGIIVPYVIGAANGNIPAILPLISDGGAYPPEKSIFSLFQNVSAVLILITLYVKHLQFVAYYETRRSDSFWRVLSCITMIFGFIAAAGLSVLGNFSETDAFTMHNIGAGVAFLASILCLCLTTGLSFLRPLLCSRVVAFLRVSLTVTAIVALVFEKCTLKLKIFVPAGAKAPKTYRVGHVPIFLANDSPFYVNHIVAMASEWLLAFAVYVYFLTFVEEFRKSSITLPSIKFPVDQSSSDFNNVHGEASGNQSNGTATTQCGSHGLLVPDMRLFLLFLIMFAAFIEATPVKYAANQALHRSINTEPIQSLIIRSPKHNNNTKYGIVLLVISATYEKVERSEIRKQWAAVEESKMQKNGESLVIFLVGRSAELEEEASTFGDLLQVDIDETYRNLVYKIEVGFRWVQEKVASEFVAKIDSDTVVHIDRLYDILKRYETEKGSDQWLVCSAVTGAGPIRDVGSPWFTSTSDYPYQVYPRYCNGPGYVMPRAAFDKIADRMGKHMAIECEDVFFTGIVRERQEISIIDTGVVATPYTTRSYCDNNVPLLSVLNTHHQFHWSKYEKDLTAAWIALKNPICRSSRWWYDY